jgi:intracellular sulfur oxidation DsrE/DsrF family protein
MPSRLGFLAAGATIAVAAGASWPAPAAAAAGDFDLAAFTAIARTPFPHRQAFASPLVADGAVLGFMVNSLNAYDHGFEQTPGTLHAAAVLYHLGVALALDDEAWNAYRIADAVRAAGDHVDAAPGAGNPFVHGPRGWTFGELQARRASFFACNNALNDLARRTGASPEELRAHLLPGMMMVPAGVAAVNALQEERFSFFAATG